MQNNLYTEYSIQRAIAILNLVSDLKDVQHYVSNKKERVHLASVYSQIMGVNDPMPKRPENMSKYTGNQLNKDVSDSCSKCVSTSVMTGHVSSALQTANEYKKKLESYIQGHESYTPKSIKELRPNIEIK